MKRRNETGSVKTMTVHLYLKSGQVVEIECTTFTKRTDLGFEWETPTTQKRGRLFFLNADDVSAVVVHEP